MSLPGAHGATLMVHATCIDLGDHAALIRGPSGAGKSDLALRLIAGPAPAFAPLNARAMLVADDQVMLRADNGVLIASPPETIAGKLEARGVGLIDLPFKAEAPVQLIVELAHFAAIERLPLPWPVETILGVRLPVITIDPFEASAMQKLWLALRQCNQ
jgi:serine kinase of HPr protein (carbohydrate metabolism regulator)